MDFDLTPLLSRNYINALLDEKKMDKLIVYLCKLSKQLEVYQRSLVLGLKNFTFTTDEFIYKTTGIHSISLPIEFSLKKLDDICLFGSTDMLFYFRSSLLTKSIYRFHIEYIGEFKSPLMFDFNLLFRKNITFEPGILNSFLITYSKFINFRYKILCFEDLNNLYYEFKFNNIDKLPYLKIDLLSMNILKDLTKYKYLNLVSIYFNQMYILLDESNLSHMLMNFSYSEMISILSNLEEYHIKFILPDSKNAIKTLPNLYNLIEFV